MEIHHISLAEERIATLGLCLHHYLIVLEVCLLQDHLCAVRESQFLVAEGLILSFLRNLSLGRHLSHQRLFLHIVNPCGEGLCTHTFQSLLHGISSHVGLTLLFLFHIKGHEVLVVDTDHLLGILVHHVDRQLLRQGIHCLIEVLNRGDGVTLEEVLDILVGIFLVLTLVAIGVHLLQSTDIVSLGTGILRSSKAEVVGTLSLTGHSLQGFDVLTFLSHANQHEGILGTGQLQEVAILSLSLDERTIGLLLNLRETGIEHSTHHVVQVVLHKISSRLFQFCWDGVTLHREHEDGVLLLLVLLGYVDGLLIVGYRLVDYLGCIGRHHDVAEHLLDQVLRIVHIDVTHDDDTLVVGTIPFLIIGDEFLGLEVVHDLHLTDRHTVAVL